MEPEESDLRDRLTEFPLGIIHILCNHFLGERVGVQRYVQNYQKNRQKIVKKIVKKVL